MGCVLVGQVGKDIGCCHIYLTIIVSLTEIQKSTFKAPKKKPDKLYVCKISKTVSFKFYLIENLDLEGK